MIADYRELIQGSLLSEYLALYEKPNLFASFPPLHLLPFFLMSRSYECFLLYLPVDYRSGLLETCKSLIPAILSEEHQRGSPLFVFCYL